MTDEHEGASPESVPSSVLRALGSLDHTAHALVMSLLSGERILASGRVTRERGSRTGLRWRELAVDALRGKSPEWHAVAHALGNAGGRFALAWKARPTLARAAGVSEDTVSRVVRALEATGLVVVLERRRRGAVNAGWQAIALTIPRPADLSLAAWDGARRASAEAFLAETKRRRSGDPRGHWLRELAPVVEALGWWASMVLASGPVSGPASGPVSGPASGPVSGPVPNRWPETETGVAAEVPSRAISPPDAPSCAACAAETTEAAAATCAHEPLEEHDPNASASLPPLSLKMMKSEPERRDAKPENITAGVLSLPRSPKSEKIPAPASSAGLDALAAILGAPMDDADREARQHVGGARRRLDVDDRTAGAVARKLATKIRAGATTSPAGLARTMLSEPPSPDEVARLLAPPKRTAEERRAARERERRETRAASEGFVRVERRPETTEEAQERRERVGRMLRAFGVPACAACGETHGPGVCPSGPARELLEDQGDDEPDPPDEHAPAGDPRALEEARRRREQARREAHQHEARREAAGHRPRLLP